MNHRAVGLVIVLFLAGVCAGQPPKSLAPADTPKVFEGKVVPIAAPKGKAGTKPADPAVTLVTGDGTSYPLIEDDVSKMLFLDQRLQNRPMRLTAFPMPGTGNLRVVVVQTVK